MGKRKRRKFTDEFKAEAVRLVGESEKSLGQIARDLDLTGSALRRWVEQGSGMPPRRLVASPKLAEPAAPSTVAPYFLFRSTGYAVSQASQRAAQLQAENPKARCER